MAKIEITIPNNKVVRVQAALLAQYPTPQIPDPDNEGQLIDEFTSLEWVKELLKNWIKSRVLRHERAVANDAINVDDLDMS